MRPVKKFEAKLRVRLALGTFLETLTRNHHLSFIFHQFLKTALLYNHEVRYAIVPRYEHHFGKE